MSAWKRLGWGIVVVWAVLGTQARADRLSAPVADATNWEVWTPDGGMGVATDWSYGVPLVASPSASSWLNDSSSSASQTPSSTPSASNPAPAQASSSTSASISTPLFTAASAAATGTVPASSTTVPATADAFINLGAGPYPEAGVITTGNAQAWYNSSQITSFFGGQPTSQQQAAFSSAILQRVEQTFQLSGVSVNLTTNPSVSAAHTLSVVSNTSAALLPAALGMTDVGGNGFSFIDQGAKSAQSLDQLEWIVAHNVSHELMLAFGVGENYDQTGNYIDARNANLSMMTNPSATFSQAAANALNQAIAAQDSGNATAGQLAQVLEAQTVPEPSSIALWGLLALGGLASAKRLGW
jgi:hypothetical protein